MEKQYFKYGEEEKEYLKSKDPKLGEVIDKLGHIQRGVTPDLYTALVDSIVSQQISTKAAITVWGRFLEKVRAAIPGFTAESRITPEIIATIPDEELQTCGMTMRKVTYIKELTDTILRGDLDLEHLHEMTDEEVCNRLCELKGIGVWTAEMLMTFSMERPDVMSYGDLAILRGLRMLYRHRKITPKLFQKYKRRYSLYASVASLYIWAVAGGAIEGLNDPAPKSKK